MKYALGGVEMLGYIDLVLRKPNGGLVFVDLKTGSKAPMDRELACEDQMQAYYETAYEDRKPDEVWYSHMKSGTILPVPRSEHFIAALHETAPLVMAAIEQGVFPKRLGTDCATCSRKKSCLG